jgi:uncharacterized protein with GYD domain
MQTYILLLKLTDQGIKDIANAPQRIEQAAARLEAMGGHLLDFHMVMGDYDYVAVGELPSDEAVATFLLALGSEGNVRTTTLKAFTRKEFTAIVKKLPRPKKRD